MEQMNQTAQKYTDWTKFTKVGRLDRSKPIVYYGAFRLAVANRYFGFKMSICEKDTRSCPCETEF